MSEETTPSSFVALAKDLAPAAASAPSGTQGEATPSGKRMSKAQRVECTLAWRMGSATAEELAKRYGVTSRAIRKYFHDKGIKHGELAVRQAQAVESVLTVDPKVQAQRIYDTNEETYRLLTIIRQQIQRELVLAQREGRKFGTTINEIKALKEAAAGVKVCREEIYAVLGIKEGDGAGEELPELRIRDLSDDEIKQLQSENGDELDGELLTAPIEEIDEIEDDDGQDEESAAE